MNTKCSVYKTVDFIGKRWTLLIMLELFKHGGKGRRYTELKNSIPDITPKILSQRLKELEEEGLISKKVHSVSLPVKCEYRLTPPGQDFIRIIKDIKEWALKWRLKNKHCENTDCSECVF
ncbi:helix-turn-helix transcriptional regulator [Candidatus Woesearchaeota archaeon]|nr:helix-turn-helix transcriptional regulator [Candidatus Woesearchaeota archaeon]